MGLSVAAEGVERDEQPVCLRALGCPSAQGCLYSPPTPPEQMSTMLMRVFPTHERVLQHSPGSQSVAAPIDSRQGSRPAPSVPANRTPATVTQLQAVHAEDLAALTVAATSIGSTCGDVSMVVWPGVYRSCTFTGTGTYTASHPTSTDARFRTGITVAPVADILNSATLTLGRTRITTGSPVALAGAINVPQSGAQVDIVAKDRSTGTYRKVGQTRTGTSGEFSFIARPARTTAFFAKAILNMAIVTSPRQAVVVTSKAKYILKRPRDDARIASIPVLVASADATPRQVGRLRKFRAAGHLTTSGDVLDRIRPINEEIEAR